MNATTRRGGQWSVASLGTADAASTQFNLLVCHSPVAKVFGSGCQARVRGLLKPYLKNFRKHLIIADWQWSIIHIFGARSV